MSKVKRVARGKIEEVDSEKILDLCAIAEAVLLDVGTGDGKFPYRYAKENPSTFCVGIDTIADNLLDTAGKIGRKPARGGVRNLVLVVSSLEMMPHDFDGFADRITLNFPWAGLLIGAVKPEDETARRLSQLMKPGGTLDMLLNMQVFEDESLREGMDLPPFGIEYVDAELAPGYAKFDVSITGRALLAPGKLPERTSWGRHLSVGSGRATMHITGRKSGVDGATG